MATTPPPSSPAPWAGPVYLEIQGPWSAKLLDGTKTVETRTYGLPSPLLNRSVLVLQSPEGTAGVTGLPDDLVPGEGAAAGLSVVAEVEFCASEPYPDEATWAADAGRHGVTPGVGYGWPATGCVYGWVVASIRPLPPKPLDVRLSRRLRSLFTESR